MGTTTDTPSLASTSAGGGRRGAAAPRAKRHALLGGFPVAAMTLATFLVVFAILMARLQSGVDPALGPSANRSLVAPGSARGKVVTRASGGATPAEATSGSPAAKTTPAVITRTSGSRGGEESGDA